MNKAKRSKQREAILEMLQGVKTHPTADKVYEEVRKTIPNISLGTVYRNLAKLSDESMIQKVGMVQGLNILTAIRFRIIMWYVTNVVSLLISRRSL